MTMVVSEEEKVQRTCCGMDLRRTAEEKNCWNFTAKKKKFKNQIGEINAEGEKKRKENNFVFF